MSPINGPLSTNSSQSSEKTDLQKTQERLNKFCEQHCPGVPQEKMHDMIALGGNLVKLMEKAAVNEADWEKFLEDKATPQAAVCLMWYLTSKAAEHNDLFTAGAMRVGKGNPIDGAKIEQFLKACGPSYARISTHMKENLTKADAQYGLDLRNDLLPRDKKLKDGEMLPAGKQTILFAKQPDGTLYIKLEEHGCPRFWEKQFRTLTHFQEYVGHAIDYISTRPLTQSIKKHAFKVLSKLGLSKDSKTDELKTRKEKVPEHIQTSFKKAINSLKNKNIDKKALINEGKAHGVTRMRKILQDNPDTNEGPVSQRQSQRQIALEMLNAHINENKPKGYIGEVRGNEVLLPSLGPSAKPLD